MIPKKEFYFVRHGQTDYNLSIHEKEEHPPTVSLNETGRKQAEAIEPIIASLPIKTICSSPLKRAQETKEIIAAKLAASHHEIDDLGECTGAIWREMHSLGPQTSHQPPVSEFIERVRRGMHHALSKEGPILIVAHGGVHWAICTLMDISDHGWAIDNCIPIHFYLEKEEQWKARRLSGK